MSISIKAPASKSVSHRAAIAAALAPGTSQVSNLLDSDDLHCTLDCLRSLGADIEPLSADTVKIQGFAPQEHAAGTLSLDVGESGTTCRLITPVAALGHTACRIFGRGRMHQRPIMELAAALTDQGAAFAWEDNEGCPPFVLTSQGLSGGEVQISLEQSSQYLSGLLLAGPLAESQLTVAVTGAKVISWPYVALTLKVMQAFGRPVQVQTFTQGRWEDADWTALSTIVPGHTRFVVPTGAYTPGSYRVEGDWSNASYFLAAGLLHPHGITVTGLDPDSGQGDRRILEFLRAMGAEPKVQAQGITIRPARLHGIAADMGSCPDLVPTVAVMASLGQGKTTISNVAHLRLKESDRAQALATELARIGTGVHLSADGLAIIPPPALPRGRRIRFCTYGDHRLAMSLSLLELAGIGVELDQPECVAKSFPGFWKAWEALRESL